jgi:hypothetical protein
MLKPAGTFLQATLLPPPPPSQLRARASIRRYLCTNLGCAF